MHIEDAIIVDGDSVFMKCKVEGYPAANISLGEISFQKIMNEILRVYAALLQVLFHATIYHNGQLAGVGVHLM